jgi:tetratricopeptide (TPR) repeat protein
MMRLTARKASVTLAFLSLSPISCPSAIPQAPKEERAPNNLALTAIQPKTPVELLIHYVVHLQGRGKIGSILQETRVRANKGDAHSMAILALAYLIGATGSQNAAESRTWSEKGAALNDPCCLILLSALYRDGKGGLSKDYPRALELLNEAQKMDPPDAKYCIGKLLITGNSDQKKDEKAIELISEAAGEGSGDASYFLARMYELGYWGNKPDRVKAGKLYLEAAQSGQEDAMIMIAEDYEFGIGVPKNHKTDSLLAQRGGRGWKPRRET